MRIIMCTVVRTVKGRRNARDRGNPETMRLTVHMLVRMMMRVTEAMLHYHDTSEPTGDRPAPPRGKARTWCDEIVQRAEVTTVRSDVTCPKCAAWLK
jgi:hypothetical protein